MYTIIHLVTVISLCTVLPIYNSPTVGAATTAEPLLLTEYLQQGDIDTARKLSLVVDNEGVIPSSYAGFITVDKVLKSHLFFWFFQALNSDPKAPLVVWLNGGPGESSMIGLLLENGPLQLDKSTNGEDIYKRRNNTWAQRFSMLYIDNPVGAGYSYSESGEKGYRTTQDGYTKDLYEFIQQFYIMFPEYLNRDLYIGGQSYAGKYVPAFAYRVHQEIRDRGSRIPLKGIYLGGPLIDAKVQLIQISDLYYTLGYITKEELNESKNNATDKIREIERYETNDVEPMFSKHHLNNFYTTEEIHYDEINNLMKSDSLESLLHVGNSSFGNDLDNIYASLIIGDILVSTSSKLAELLDNYKVLIYTGDLDGLITSPGVETVLQSLPWSMRSTYNCCRREAWTGEKNKTKGYFSRVSTFCRVVIRGAGHRAGFDQPDNTLEMMTDFVTNGCITSSSSHINQSVCSPAVNSGQTLNFVFSSFVLLYSVLALVG